MGKPAATISSYHMCPIKRLKNLTIVAGAAYVLIGGLPVALIGDKCVCVKDHLMRLLQVQLLSLSMVKASHG